MLTVFRDSSPTLQVQREAAVLAEYTGYSAACCATVADSEGAAALLRLVRGANRSVPHAAFTRGALATLRNLARRPDTAAAVLAAPACPQVLGEQVQLFRDQRVRAVIFMACSGPQCCTPKRGCKESATVQRPTQ